MPLPTFRAWKNKMETDGKLKRPSTPSLLCIQNPESKNQLLFSDAYIEKVKAARGEVRKRNVKPESAMKHALLKVTLPIFDARIADFIIKRFKDTNGFESHLKDYVQELAKPTLSRLEELKREYEENVKKALAEFESDRD